MTDLIPIPAGTPDIAISERAYFEGSTIKAISDYRVGGYLVPFGYPKDSEGEFFTANTNYRLDYYGFAQNGSEYTGGQIPVLFHHALTDVGGLRIGAIDYLRMDDYGLYAEASLIPDAVQNVSAIIERDFLADVTQGRVGWSSGSAPHLVLDGQNGQLAEWPIVEGTLTYSPKGGKRTTVAAIKAANEQGIPQDVPTDAKEHPAIEQPSAEPEKPRIYRPIKIKGHEIMNPMLMIPALEKAGLNPEQILVALKELGAAEPAEEAPTMAEPTPETPADVPPVDDAMQAKGDTVDVKAVIAAVKQQLAADAQVKANTPPKSDVPSFTGGKPAAKGNIQVLSKYRNLSAQDMAFLKSVRNITGKSAWNPGIEYEREMADKAIKAFEAGNLDTEDGLVKSLYAVKADLNNTLVAEDGADWVPTLWSSDLWERTRIENRVASSIQSFAMPSPSYEYPIESTDPEVYSVAETDDNAEMSAASGFTFTRSKVVADKITFTAKKLGVQVGFSTEITEDSIIQFIPQLRSQALRAMQNAVDNVILNADATTGTTNINYADGNTSSVPKAKFLYGGGDGMRHLALVDATGQGLNASNASVTLSLIRRAIALLDEPYSVRPSEIKLFTDVATWHRMKSIDELLVYMNNGRGSTVVDGMVPTIDGSEVIPSEELSKTNSSGFVSATGANNTRGQVVVVHTPSWKLGYRRQITSDVSYLPWNDAYIMTITARMALGRRDTLCASLLYNINVD